VQHIRNDAGVAAHEIEEPTPCGELRRRRGLRLRPVTQRELDDVQAEPSEPLVGVRHGEFRPVPRRRRRHDVCGSVSRSCGEQRILRLVAGMQLVASHEGEGSNHPRSVRRAANERATYAGTVPSLYEMTADVPFVAPVMVGAFDGWIDASAAATSAAATLAENGEVVARFDGDALYDYRARRPVLDVVDGTLARLEWPELTVRSVEAGGRHLLILTGPEPDYHWRQLGTDVLDLCLRAGVVQWVSLGAIPAAVPHTRPVPVLATASREGLLREDESQGPQGLLRVPGAALSTLELAVSGTGIPAVGFFAQVPHYVGGPFAIASMALLEHLGRHLGVELPLGSLMADAQEQRDRLDAAVAADEDAGAYLQRLEALAGEDRLTSGDELASEIERFLSERGREGGDDAGPFEGR
jgi:PAC2 family